MAKGKERTLRCFVIMPFSDVTFKDHKGQDRDLRKIDLDRIYTEFFRKTVKSYRRGNAKFSNVHRYEGHVGNFVKGIVNDLYEYDLVLADLTGLNPNVCYELGVRHTLRVGTIIVTQNIDSIPSDLRSYFAVQYKYNRDSKKRRKLVSTFKRKLYDVIARFLGDQDRPDSPVSDFLVRRSVSRDSVMRKNLEGNIAIIRFMKEQYATDMDAVIKCLSQWVRGKPAMLYRISICAQPFLHRVVYLNEPREIIEFLDRFMSCVQISQRNMEFIRKVLCQNRTIEEAKPIEFGFCDRKGRYHSAFDLREHYEFNSRDRKYFAKVSEPVLRSFNYFIDKWGRELRRCPPS